VSGAQRNRVASPVFLNHSNMGTVESCEFEGALVVSRDVFFLMG
jgi:hypothetical protein